MLPMITVDEARRLVLENLPSISAEEVHFEGSLGRVLAEGLQATCDIPPFDRVAVDGFAVRSDDVRTTPVDLELVGEVRAGHGDPGTVGPGECRAIMTGAPLPGGADAAQMVEQTRRHGNRVTILDSVRPGEHVTRRASEVVAGTEVVGAGRMIGAAETAIIATFGHTQVRVVRRPRVGLLATGDELVDMEDEPGPGQIRNSNAYSLAAQARAFGIEPEILGVARDDRNDLRGRIGAGLEMDVLVLSGGVSMGAYDFVRDVLEELGLEVVFGRVAMKPGKPTVFARGGGTLVFGLPGNPVSAFVAFENFVRPALGRLCGFRAPDLTRVRGELQREMKQIPGRTAFLPALTSWTPEGWKIQPLRWKGSADIVGFSRADSLVIFPAELDRLEQGDPVDALLLSDYQQRRAASAD